MRLRDPGFQGLIADLGVISFAALVIATADDEKIGSVLTGLQPHIVVGIQRVPIERVRDSARS